MTKSIYEPASPEDGVRMLITRYYPRGVKNDRFDRWVRSLSPSRELLSSYKGGEKSWERFRESFLVELSSGQESLDALGMLRALGERGDVTLLCYERTGTPCHRDVVKEVVADPDLLVSERGAPPQDLSTARGRRLGRGATSGRVRPGNLSAPQSRRIRFYPRRKVGEKAPK